MQKRKVGRGNKRRIRHPANWSMSDTHEGFFWLYLSITIAFKCILYSTINCFVKYLNHFDDFSTFLNTLKAKDGSFALNFSFIMVLDSEMIFEN